MSYDKKKRNKEEIFDYLFFMLLLTVYTVLTFWLFFKQVYGSEMLYHSDMKAYILEMQGLDSGYSFPYPFFFKFAAFLHLIIASPKVAVATAVTILNSLSVIILKYYADKLLGPIAKKDPKKRIWISMLVTVLVFGLFFVSMLYGIGFELPGIWRRYRGVFSPNPYHNATYLATRPFAILTFFVFAKVIKEYEENFKWKDAVLFGVVLFMTTITKPSFTFVLVPTAGLVMLYRLCHKKFRNFKNTVLLGLSFIPTFGALIYQYMGVFAPVEGTETGIGFGLGKAWSYHCDNIPLAIFLGLAFPIAVLILNYKELKTDSVFRVSWQLLAVSLCEVLFLYEKGFRVGDVNFSWGYMHGMFFAFVASAYLLFRKTFECVNVPKKTKNKKSVPKKNIRSCCFLLGQWGLFLMHLLWGLLYFKTIFFGELYY